MKNEDSKNELVKQASNIINNDNESKVVSFFDLTTNKIKTCIKNIRQNFFQLGAYLSDIKDSDQIKEVFNYKLGRECKNIYEYAEQEFRLSKSTVCNLIGIVSRFGNMRSSLKNEYEKYIYSQLCEMLPLTDNQLGLVTPDMTVREIKSLRKVKEKKIVQTSGQKDEVLINKENELGYTLKNDAMRLDFLKGYKNWGLWLEVKELNLKFYKCNLNNGDFLIATEYNYFDKTSFKNSPLTDYRIIKKGTSPDYYGYCKYAQIESEVLSYLKSTKARVLINPENVIEVKNESCR